MKLVRNIIFLFFAFSLCGCASTTRKENITKNETLLEPSAMVKFVDIPVPAGFKIIPLDSYSFESAGIRVGVLKYQGKANADQVVNFYKEQMPMYNWNLLNVVQYGEMLLNFDRENETCIVRLMPKGNNMTVAISLGPKSQFSPKKAKQPIK